MARPTRLQKDGEEQHTHVDYFYNLIQDDLRNKQRKKSDVMVVLAQGAGVEDIPRCFADLRVFRFKRNAGELKRVLEDKNTKRCWRAHTERQPDSVSQYNYNYTTHSNKPDSRTVLQSV